MRRFIAALAAIWLFGATPAHAQGLLQRMAALERTVEALAAQNAALRTAHDQLSQRHGALQDAHTNLAAEHRAVQTALRGAVLASREPCGQLGPRWREYGDAAGRFLIGVSGDFPAGDEGGEQTVRLTEAQMPRHRHHFVGDTTTIGGWGGRITHKISVGDQHVYGRYTPNGTIQPTGGDQPHNNMPPWRAVYFCVYD